MASCVGTVIEYWETTSCDGIMLSGDGRGADAHPGTGPRWHCLVCLVRLVCPVQPQPGIASAQQSLGNCVCNVVCDRASWQPVCSRHELTTREERRLARLPRTCPWTARLLVAFRQFVLQRHWHFSTFQVLESPSASFFILDFSIPFLCACSLSVRRVNFPALLHAQTTQQSDVRL